MATETELFEDIDDARKRRVLEWLQMEVVIRSGFDTEFARILQAAHQTLMRDAPPGYDPDEALRRRRFAVPTAPRTELFEDLGDAQKLRVLRWLQVESFIRKSFDSQFGRIIEAARRTLMREAPPGYDPDEEVTRERLGEDQ